MTLVEMLERAQDEHEHGLRLVDRAERARWRSWAEVVSSAERIAGGLREVGLKPGERVGLVYPTSEEFFDAFFGALLAGAVPVPLYPPVRLGRLDEYHERTAAMLAAAGVRLVLAASRVRRVLGPAVAPVRPELGCLSLDQLPSSPGADRAAVAPGDLALVQFSSGTTVEPKPVALSHRAVAAQVEILNGCWPQPDGQRLDSGVSWLPLYHDMGLIGCVLPALAARGTLTLIPPEVFVTRPVIWLRTVSRYRATISPAPNFAYGLCVAKVRDEDLDGVDLSAWRVALNGAEPVAVRVLEAFADRFSRWGFRREALTPVYGLSEAALAVTFSDLEKPFTSLRFDREALTGHGRAVPADRGLELVSVGRPLPGFELRIADRSGQAVPAGFRGRVLVRGPSLMESYLGLPDATARALSGGWLDTGDLGFLVDGELYLTGRAKDVVIINGRNHLPAEIEAACDAVPGVRTGCTVAVSWLPEDADGERLLVLVEGRDGLDARERAALATGCAREICAACGLEPARVEVLEPGTLPRTSSGKLRRREALRLWLDGRLAPPARVTPLRLATAVARSKLAFARLAWSDRDGG